MHSPAELTVAFRAKGCKITPQRQLLFRLLHENTAHPSAEVLYALAHAQMPGISLRTVYQTLNDLAEMGELHVLEFGTGAARFDPNVGDHHHLVCDRCGEVRDVDVPGADRLAPHGGAHGYVGATAHVVFRGTCPSCTLARVV